MELQGLQDQLKALESERERISQQGLDTSFQDATIRDVRQHIADLESQQNLQERVDQAKETGYILDTIKINGLPAIAFSHTPENHELLAIAIQKWGLEQQDAFNQTVNNLEYELTQERILNNDLNTDVQRLERNEYQFKLDIGELTNKLQNAAGIIEEKDAEIKRLQDQQNNPQAVEVAQLSVEEQETKLVADLMGNRLKVTDIRFKDESGLDRRKVLANNALTGEEIEEYAIYSKTRWEEISQEAAEQLRADYANKKAELEAQIAVIPTIEPNIEYVKPVTETDEAAEIQPFPNQVQATNNGDLQGDQGNESLHEVVSEESEVITLESLDARLKALELKVAA